MKTVEERLAALEAFQARLTSALGGAQVAPQAASLEDDIRASRDPKFGDPVVRKDPKNWPGESQSGKPYSQCPPEYLDQLAGLLEWKAGKEDQEPEKQKYARYSRLDASRARGWAARLRASGPSVKPPAPLPGAFDTADLDGKADDDFTF